jgi:hypothetical protein
VIKFITAIEIINRNLELAGRDCIDVHKQEVLDKIKKDHPIRSRFKKWHGK